MPTLYPTDAAGKSRFLYDMLPTVDALVKAGSTVGKWAWNLPRIDDRLRPDLGLSDAAIVNLAQAMRSILMGIGETPNQFADAQYLQATTVSDLIGVLWLSLNGGSQTWP